MSDPAAIREADRAGSANARADWAAMMTDDDAAQGEDTPVAGALRPGTRRHYALAGKATLTVRSTATAARFTYKVTQSDPEPGRMPVWFVMVLTGPNNEADYAYLGTIFADGFRSTRKSRISQSAPSFLAFQWFSRHWEDTRIDVWHEGRCCRCGRALTTPESIESGIGPVCAGKEGAL